MRRRLALVLAYAAAAASSGCVAPLPPCSETGQCEMLPMLGDTTMGTAADPTIGTTIDLDSTGTASDPICGNGEIEGDEECDDADLVDGDGCNADCRPSLRILAERTFGGGPGEADVGNGIGVGRDEGIVVVGTLRHDMIEHVFVRGLDPALDDRYADDDPPEEGPSRAHGVAVNPAGYAATAGTIGGSGAADAYVLFHDPTGERMWTQRHDGVDLLDDAMHGIVFDPFGQPFAAGTTATVAGDIAILFLHYTADGLLISDDQIAPAPGVSLFARSVAYGPGQILAFAGAQSSNVGQEILVGAVALMGGSVDTVNVGDAPGAEAHGVAIDNDGDVIVVGVQHGTERAWAGKFTPSLETIWLQTFDDGARSELFAVVVSPDNSLYLVGDHGDDVRGLDILVVHVSAEGDGLASAVHDVGGGNDIARAAALDGDGTLLVTGATQLAGDDDVLVLRLAP